MKQKHRRAGANLFFIEFIIVLFFFLIVSTVCIRIFVRSHQITLGAEALSQAQTKASELAEWIEAAWSETDLSTQKDSPSTEFLLPVDKLREIYPELVLAEDGCTLGFDRRFLPCPLEEAFYTFLISCSEATVPETPEAAFTEVSDLEAHISVRSREASVYDLTVRYHRPLTRGEVLS